MSSRHRDGGRPACSIYNWCLLGRLSEGPKAAAVRDTERRQHRQRVVPLQERPQTGVLIRGNESCAGAAAPQEQHAENLGPVSAGRREEVQQPQPQGRHLNGMEVTLSRQALA